MISFFLKYKVNADYVTTCDCGTSKFNNYKKEIPVVNTSSDEEDIKKYKKMFDDGIITEEEFNAKKKQILGL